jgi:alkanesulfonate monooxygenase SsuD/methylene tetrahydromethanopterin reductase-like flavin-dependent oxidoreductase (luciferase family)
MRQTRPIRFVTGGNRGSDPVQLISRARRAEEIGYATFGMADHFMTALAPLLALQAVANATRNMRLTQLVLAQDFRHPAVLAKELATLDVLSGGRLEVGLGAGWMRSEFEQAGIRFDRASAVSSDWRSPSLSSRACLPTSLSTFRAGISPSGAWTVRPSPSSGPARRS